MGTCPQCGNPVDPNNRFCAVCGRDILGPPSVVAPPLAASSPATPMAQPSVAVSTGMPPQTSGKAIVSLISGIFFFALPTAILAIIFGHLSLSDIKKSAGRLQGRGLAITGLVLGYAGIAAIPIILIIAAIAIPNLLRARISADETSALAGVRAINQAQVRYRVTYGGFACGLEDLGGASGSCSPSEGHACLLDDKLASGRKYGYIFEIRNCGPAPEGSSMGTYSVTAHPEKFHGTGVRSFCSDQTSVIRYSQSGSADECVKSGEPME